MYSLPSRRRRRSWEEKRAQSYYANENARARLQCSVAICPSFARLPFSFRSSLQKKRLIQEQESVRGSQVSIMAYRLPKFLI